MQKIHKWMHKKHTGSLLDNMPLLVSLIIACAVLCSALSIINIMSLREDIKSVARGYLLLMETEGYLSSANAISLEQELMAKGVKTIDYTGTTMSAPGYGSRIYLKMDCVVSAKVLNNSGDTLWDMFFENKEITIPVLLTSTAKY